MKSEWQNDVAILLTQLLDVAQANRTRSPFDLMPLFDDPFLIAGGVLEQYIELVGPKLINDGLAVFEKMMPGYMSVLESGSADPAAGCGAGQ
jgi:hypothetical protein